MRALIFYICLLTACFAYGAKDIIILPQFAVSDTIVRQLTFLQLHRHTFEIRENTGIDGVARRTPNNMSGVDRVEDGSQAV